MEKKNAGPVIVGLLASLLLIVLACIGLGALAHIGWNLAEVGWNAVG
jgi:hypothetical protein